MLKEWTEQVGKRGGKKWVNTKTGRVVYGKKPSERAGKADAKGSDKKPTKADAIASAKASASASIDKVLGGGKLTAKQVSALGESLKNVSFADVKAMRDKLGGVKVGRTKEAAIESLLTKAKEMSKTKPKAESVPAKEADKPAQAEAPKPESAKKSEPKKPSDAKGSVSELSDRAFAIYEKPLRTPQAKIDEVREGISNLSKADLATIANRVEIVGAQKKTAKQLVDMITSQLNDRVGTANRRVMMDRPTTPPPEQAPSPEQPAQPETPKAEAQPRGVVTPSTEKPSSPITTAPKTIAEAKDLATALRSHIDDVSGTVVARCVIASTALAHVSPGSEVHVGTLRLPNGKTDAHAVTKIGNYWFDVTADQYGDKSLKVQVFDKLPAAYEGFAKTDGESLLSRSELAESREISARLKKQAEGVTPSPSKATQTKLDQSWPNVKIDKKTGDIIDLDTGKVIPPPKDYDGGFAGPVMTAMEQIQQQRMTHGRIIGTLSKIGSLLIGSKNRQ